jgi:hypothetical protein
MRLCLVDYVRYNRDNYGGIGKRVLVVSQVLSSLALTEKHESQQRLYITYFGDHGDHQYGASYSFTLLICRAARYVYDI